MEVKQKNILQNILYYSLIAVIVALSVFYMIALAPNDVMMYAKVVYYIWIAGLLLVLMLDILATIMCRGKFCTGLLFFALTCACIVMAIIVYCDLIVGGVLPEASMYLFTRLVIFSGVIDVLSVICYTTGEFICGLNSSAQKRK